MTEQRNTKQREAVRAAMVNEDAFVSAQRLHEILRKGGATVGLATVYRALNSMVRSGEVDMITTAEGENIYRFCETASHHHHLVCQNCGSATEISGEYVEKWAAEIAAQNGFSATRHVIDIFGYCPNCQKTS